MKKILVVILAVLSFGVITAKADNDRVIAKEALPAKAQQFINTHFAKIKIAQEVNKYIKLVATLFMSIINSFRRINCYGRRS